MNHSDKLEAIFALQESLNRQIGIETASLDDEGRERWLLNYARAMSQEIAELTDSVPWKWWARYQKRDFQNARVELVDLFHFLVSAAQVLGMSADDLFQAYQRKHQVNQDRIAGGYHQKDPDDCRHV
ncbi:MAG: dUTPase [Candidatus Methylacidiphilaceae bacterium]